MVAKMLYEQAKSLTVSQETDAVTVLKGDDKL